MTLRHWLPAISEDAVLKKHSRWCKGQPATGAGPVGGDWLRGKGLRFGVAVRCKPFHSSLFVPLSDTISNCQTQPDERLSPKYCSPPKFNQ